MTRYGTPKYYYHPDYKSTSTFKRFMSGATIVCVLMVIGGFMGTVFTPLSYSGIFAVMAGLGVTILILLALLLAGKILSDRILMEWRIRPR